MKNCRICLEEGGDLCEPCDCKGTMGWIHQDCLKDLIYHSQENTCSICAIPFTKETIIPRPWQKEGILQLIPCWWYATGIHLHIFGTLLFSIRSATFCFLVSFGRLSWKKERERLSWSSLWFEGLCLLLGSFIGVGYLFILLGIVSMILGCWMVLDTERMMDPLFLLNIITGLFTSLLVVCWRILWIQKYDLFFWVTSSCGLWVNIFSFNSLILFSTLNERRIPWTPITYLSLTFGNLFSTWNEHLDWQDLPLGELLLLSSITVPFFALVLHNRVTSPYLLSFFLMGLFPLLFQSSIGYPFLFLYHLYRSWKQGWWDCYSLVTFIILKELAISSHGLYWSGLIVSFTSYLEDGNEPLFDAHRNSFPYLLLATLCLLSLLGVPCMLLVTCQFFYLLELGSIESYVNRTKHATSNNLNV